MFGFSYVALDGFAVEDVPVAGILCCAFSAGVDDVPTKVSEGCLPFSTLFYS